MICENEWPDKNLESFKRPTIFDIAKANDYRTILINIQGDLPDLVFREIDMKKADEVYLSDEAFNFYTDDADSNAACFLNKRLTQEKGLFIFLEKRGAHTPYQKRYPINEPEHNIFRPSLEAGELYEVPKRRKIINSYKNTLRYNIDNFFKNLLGDAPKKLRDCTIIYTSDHGQSFMEYGQLESHSTYYLEQAIVPFLIFSTDSWVLENLIRPESIPFTLHHMNITPTIQSILCKDLNNISGEYSSLVSAKTFRRPPLVYTIAGVPWNCELSGPISTDKNGKIILPVDKYIY